METAPVSSRQRNAITYAAAIALVFLYGLAVFFGSASTGFAIFSEKSGAVFSISVSGDSAYSFSFKNNKNETLTGASANITLPKAANASNYGAASLLETDSAKILSWKFDSVSANINTTLTFTSDAPPTEAKVSAVDASNASVSETVAIAAATTTTTPAGNATTTTIGNATTTTISENTTTTTAPPAEEEKILTRAEKIKDKSFVENYKSDFKKTRGNNLPDEWYNKKNTDLGESDESDWNWDALSQKENYNGDPSLAYDLDIKKNSDGAAKIYSKVIETNETGYVELSFLYKPNFSGQRANVGMEIFSGSEEQTIGVGITDLGAVSSGEDFDVVNENLKNGWMNVSAITNLKLAPSKVRIFVEGIPSEGDSSSNFFLNQISARLIK